MMKDLFMDDKMKGEAAGTIAAGGGSAGSAQTMGGSLFQVRHSPEIID